MTAKVVLIDKSSSEVVNEAKFYQTK